MAQKIHTVHKYKEENGTSMKLIKLIDSSKRLSTIFWSN